MKRPVLFILFSLILFTALPGHPSHPRQPPVPEKVWPTSSEEILLTDPWHFKKPWVAADPNHEGWLFAYVSGTLLRSRDYGKNWTRIGKGLPEKAIFNCSDSLFPCPIAFSPFVKDTILLATNRESVGGVPFRSDDGGENWYPMNVCENGPGYFRNNFKFSATSSAVFSRRDKETIYFPVLSEGACQPVFVSLDGGRTIVPNPQCPFYKQQCKNPPKKSFCSDNSSCFNMGGDYWGGDMLISMSPSADEMFEFDFHGSLGQEYIARYKTLDRKTGQLCASSSVFVDLGTVPGGKLSGQGRFRSPVFFTGEDEMFTVCDIVETGSLNGAPTYGRMPRPFLARCGGRSDGRFVFKFVSFLPEGSESIVTDMKKAGTLVFFSVADKDLAEFRFLAWNTGAGGGWTRFGEEGSPFFSVVGTANGQDVYFITRKRDSYNSFRSLLKVIHLNGTTLKFSTEIRYDFTALNTGVTGFHVEENGAVRRFLGRDIHPFRGLDGTTRYALLRAAELDLGTDPDKLAFNEGQENRASFDLSFSSVPIVTVCTSNFSSMTVEERTGPEGSPELWAYFSSDAGVWRNRRFHRQYSQEHPYELLLGFENISGGYSCGNECSGQIPSKDLGNYCRKVIVDHEENGLTVLYAACRSGLWKGTEQEDKSFSWSLAYDPPVKAGPDAGVIDVLKSGCFFLAVTAEGLFRSQDLLSWNTAFKPGDGLGPVTAVSSFPGNPSRLVMAVGSALYVPGGGGIFLSDDQGVTWKQAVTLDAASELPVRKIECLSANGTETVYYLTANGLLNRLELEKKESDGKIPADPVPPEPEPAEVQPEGVPAITTS